MIKKIGMLGALSLLSFASFASSKDIVDDEIPLVWSPIITLSGGPAWASTYQNTHVYPTPGVYNLYNSPRNTRTIGTGEIFFGLQRVFSPGLTWQFGIGAAGAGNAELNGTVNVFGVANAYTYKYNVNHARVELKGAIIGNSFSPVQPYVSGSFGVGWNNSTSFASTSSNSVLYPPLYFSPKTVVAFAYTAGIGLVAPIAKNWQVGAGYEFADWGKTELGVNDALPYNGPTLTHVYTNAAIFSLSYLGYL